ncbi:MAG: glycosyltransferase family 4 protein [bacterium]
MRLLLFNFATDPDHPAWGFATRWIEGLARRLAFVHVISLQVASARLPENVRVYSTGKERGFSKSRRVAAFYRNLWHVLSTDEIDVCFCHMNALFGILGAPLLKAYRIPMVTWYAHPSLNQTLRTVHWLSDRMVSSLSTAYPYRHDKLAVVGQGIDTALFAPNGTAPEEPPTILCVGRLSPAKGHPALLRSAALLRERWRNAFRVVILGAPAAPGDAQYAESLHELARALGLQDIVQFSPRSAWASLPDWYGRCTVHVNLTPTGFGDKVAWEAMSCARPCVVANHGFRETLGRYAPDLLFRHNDPEDLTQKLVHQLGLPVETRSQMGLYLRDQVIRFHSFDRLMDRLVAIFQDVREHSRRQSA